MNTGGGSGSRVSLPLKVAENPVLSSRSTNLESKQIVFFNLSCF